MISAEPVQPVREQAKRKRGRPRKETASLPPPVKKPRGRPRKDPSSLPSQGRGGVRGRARGRARGRGRGRGSFLDEPSTCQEVVNEVERLIIVHMYFKHYCSCISGDQEEYLSRELRRQSLAAVQDVPISLYLGITTTGFSGTSTGRMINYIVLSADGRRRRRRERILEIESC